MPPNNSNLGDLSVTLRADTAQFEAGMKSAQNTAETTGSKVEASVLKQASAFRQLIGRVTATVGVFVTMFEIGQKVQSLFEDATPVAEKFLGTISSQDAANQLQALNKQIGELQNRISGGLLNDLRNLRQGETTAQVRRQIEVLAGTQQTLELRATAERNRAIQQQLQKELAAYTQKIQSEQRADFNAIQKAERAAIDASDAAAQAEANNLEGTERLRAQAELDIATLKRQLSKAQSNEEIEALNRQIAARNARLSIDLEKERLDVMKEQTKELLRQQTIFEDLQQRQVGAFGVGNLEATLKAIRGDLQSIRGVIR